MSARLVPAAQSSKAAHSDPTRHSAVPMQVQQQSLLQLSPAEGLAKAFAREHRLSATRRQVSAALSDDYESGDTPAGDEGGGDEGGEAKQLLSPDQLRPLDRSPDASHALHTRHAAAGAPDALVSVSRQESAEVYGSSSSIPRESSFSRPLLNGRPRKKVPPPLALPELLPLRHVASIDDLGRAALSARSNIMSSNSHSLATMEVPALEVAFFSSPVGFGPTSLSLGCQQPGSPEVQGPHILSPRPLHLKPQFTHPELRVAALALKPKDITAKFLQRYGRQPFQWNRVRNVSCTPFHELIGLSEAIMYHAVLDIAPDVGSHGSSADTPQQIFSSYGATTPTVMGSSKPSGTPSKAALFLKKVWWRTKTLVRIKQKSGGYTSPTLHGGGTDAGSSSINDEFAYIPFGANLNNFDLFNSAEQSLRSSSLTHPSPPQFLVVKHYDTSIVDTPNFVFRLARHLTATTAEKMASHELFFYAKLSAFFCDAASPFRCPKPMFIAQLDRGDPGFCQYVCCGTGSGTVATIGLEDMQRSGFTFDHTQGDGLYEESTIYSVLIALAYLHSCLWDRCHEPSLQGLEPASIILFIHRAAPKIQHLRSKKEFAKISIRSVFDRWSTYPPSSYLNSPSTRLMFGFLQHRWDIIRTSALEIIHRRDTVLHGDVHYKNIGFRTKHIVGSVGSTQSNRQRRSAAAATSGGGGGDRGAGAAGGMLHRFFSQENIATAGGVPALVTSPRVLHATQPYPTSPIAKQNAETLDVQPCFLDYQSSGPGSIAAELLYFMCTSVPVDVDLSSHDDLLDVSQYQHNSSSAHSAPPLSGVALTSNSFAGLSPVAVDSDDATVAAAMSSARVRSASTCSTAGKMTLGELLSFDVMLITTYHQNLDPHVQVGYPLPQLIHDVYVLARHWTGCVFFDLASSDPRERATLKTLSQYKQMITWGERTAERVVAMCVAVFAEVDGRIPAATITATQQQHQEPNSAAQPTDTTVVQDGA